MNKKKTIGGATTMKKIESILDFMVDVDNSKVDTLRMLYVALNTNNYNSLVAHLKAKDVVKVKEVVKPKSKQVWML